MLCVAQEIFRKLSFEKFGSLRKVTAVVTYVVSIIVQFQCAWCRLYSVLMQQAPHKLEWRTDPCISKIRLKFQIDKFSYWSVMIEVSYAYPMCVFLLVCFLIWASSFFFTTNERILFSPFSSATELMLRTDRSRLSFAFFHFHFSQYFRFCVDKLTHKITISYHSFHFVILVRNRFDIRYFGIVYQLYILRQGKVNVTTVLYWVETLEQFLTFINLKK